MNSDRTEASRIDRYLPRGLLVLGAVAVGFALLVDLTPWGDAAGIGWRQFGNKQRGLVLAGLALAAVGALLGTERGQRFLQRHPAPPADPGHIGYLLVVIGLTAGLLELLLRLIQNSLHVRFVHLSPHLTWTAPLSWVAFLTVPAMLFILLARLRVPRFGSRPGATFALVFIAAIGVLVLFTPELHWTAITLLSAGVAWQLSGRIARHADGANRTLRRAAGILVTLVAVLGIAVTGARHVGESIRRARLPTPEADAPNVLLIILDTVRAHNLSLYGYTRPTTPFLGEFGRRGVVFERAFATAPWTLPSHASMFTGAWAGQQAGDWQHPIDPRHPTLAELLAAHGYLTAGFVANNRYCGLNTGLQRGFSRYDVDQLSTAELIAASSLGRLLFGPGWVREHVRKPADEVSAEFLAWQAGTGGRPFFAFLNYFDAHDPYRAPPPFDGRFTVQDLPPAPLDSSVPGFSAGKIRRWLASYDGAIAHLDGELRRLFDRLEDRGVLDRTVVIIASDHGEQFGEKGLFFHGNSLYASLLHVPLVISFPPSVPAAYRVPDPVTLRDLPATILDLAGIRGSPLPGRSLAAYWSPTLAASAPPGPFAGTVVAETSGRSQDEAWNPTSRGDMRSVISGDMHYILNGDGEEELYDIGRDEWELENLIAAPGSEVVVYRLRTQLERMTVGKGETGLSSVAGGAAAR